LFAGCTESRSEPTSTVTGKVTYQGTALTAGARLILDDKSKGVRMTFILTDGGNFTVPETASFPAGTYAVGVLPPAGEEVPTSGADYDALMTNSSAAGTTETSDSDFPLPEEFQDPATSGKTVEISSGEQTVDIAFE